MNTFDIKNNATGQVLFRGVLPIGVDINDLLSAMSSGRVRVQPFSLGAGETMNKNVEKALEAVDNTSDGVDAEEELDEDGWPIIPEKPVKPVRKVKSKKK